MYISLCFQGAIVLTENSRPVQMTKQVSSVAGKNKYDDDDDDDSTSSASSTMSLNVASFDKNQDKTSEGRQGLRVQGQGGAAVTAVTTGTTTRGSQDNTSGHHQGQGNGRVSITENIEKYT